MWVFAWFSIFHIDHGHDQVASWCWKVKPNFSTHWRALARSMKIPNFPTFKSLRNLFSLFPIKHVMTPHSKNPASQIGSRHVRWQEITSSHYSNPAHHDNHRSAAQKCMCLRCRSLKQILPELAGVVTLCKRHKKDHHLHLLPLKWTPPHLSYCIHPDPRVPLSTNIKSFTPSVSCQPPLIDSP